MSQDNKLLTDERQKRETLILMQGQFQRPSVAPTVEYGNPFDLLLGQAFKPQELKRYIPAPEVETIMAIDVCAICGEVKCSCKDRRILKFKV